MSKVFSFFIGDAAGLLPFKNALTAAKLFFAVFFLLIVYAIVRAVVYRRSLTLHKAPTAVVFSYIASSLANILVCIFFSWFLALPLCIILTLIFMFTTKSEVNDANAEERSGVWGLNSDIRRIRGELFSDMTVQEQIDYRNSVKEYNFNMWLFGIVSIAVAVLFIAACYFFGAGYQFILPF